MVSMIRLFTRKSHSIIAVALFVLALLSLFLPHFIARSDNGGFFKRTLWESSFSHGWGLSYNKYVYESQYPRVGIIFTRTDRTTFSESRERAQIASAIRQLRFEYGDAYRNHDIRIRKDPKRPDDNTSFPIEWIAVIVVGDWSNKNAWYSCGAVISANAALDQATPPANAAGNLKLQLNAVVLESTQRGYSVDSNWRYLLKMPGGEN